MAGAVQRHPESGLLGREKVRGGDHRRINLEPHAFPDEASIARWDFLYGRHLLRGTVSATAAMGSTGKSSMGIVEALALASGKATARRAGAEAIAGAADQSGGQSQRGGQAHRGGHATSRPDQGGYRRTPVHPREGRDQIQDRQASDDRLDQAQRCVHRQAAQLVEDQGDRRAQRRPLCRYPRGERKRQQRHPRRDRVLRPHSRAGQLRGSPLAPYPQGKQPRRVARTRRAAPAPSSMPAEAFACSKK